MSSIILTEGYTPRPFSALDTFHADDWTLKVTGIAYHSERPRQGLIDATLTKATEVLPQPAVTDNRYGVGFIGIHDGRGACFSFVDWWESENELHHHTFLAPWEQPSQLIDVTGQGFTACAWDLALISHERLAWVSHVLANPGGPDLNAYLTDRLEGHH